MKKVSIIIPVYNAEAYFGDMLDSILAQTWPDIQLIVVNDGSTDRSEDVFRSREAELKKKLSEVIYLKHDQNRSASEAMNTALPFCDGEYLCWADADDLLLPDSIRKKAEYLDRFPAFALVRSNGAQFQHESGACSGGRYSEGQCSEQRYLERWCSEGRFSESRYSEGQNSEERYSTEPCLESRYSEWQYSELANSADKQVKSVFEDILFTKTYCHNGCYMVRSEVFFSCYPDKRIPVSRQEQNMQMLLPPASCSDCGYIDDILFLYRIHGDNHSLGFTHFPDMLQRRKDFEQLQLEVLPHCRCDQKLWESKIHRFWQQEIENLKQNYIEAIRQYQGI